MSVEQLNGEFPEEKDTCLVPFQKPITSVLLLKSPCLSSLVIRYGTYDTSNCFKFFKDHEYVKLWHKKDDIFWEVEPKHKKNDFKSGHIV